MFPACGHSGALARGAAGLARPSRCPAGATAAPGERASAQVMSPHVALQGDTGRAGGGRSQPLHDGDSARGGTGGFLEAGGREGRVAFLSEGLGVGVSATVPAASGVWTMLPFCLLLEG